MTNARLSADGRTLAVSVPMTFTKRGGRKLVISPDGAPPWAPPRRRVDNAMVKALARAFRWRRLMETGAYGTVEEIAAAEKINASYVSRVLRLTLLAPDIVEAILDGRQPPAMTLAALMTPFPVAWGSRPRRFRGRRRSGEAEPDPCQQERSWLLLASRGRPAGLRFGKCARHAAVRRKDLFLACRGFLRLVVTPLLTFRHHRSPNLRIIALPIQTV
ncbi:hypothetical protein [Defluviicoccus vanus]|uniref:hypothetical protein n=1 Tax=Defluviicoccus vanus TaxID=111831 RepID=UPI00295340DA|nr:hypothetical protein [Defluviicoccus vanus]